MDLSDFTTADGTRLRVGSWPAPAGRPARGTALLLNGRSEFVEKHAASAEALVERGFAVHSLDWRGQGSSDRPLPQRQRGHVEDFGVLATDLQALVEARGLAGEAARPLIVLAHSMGGHVALRWLAGWPGQAAAAVLVSPMVLVSVPGLAHAPEATVAPMRAFARLAVRRGRGRHYALGQGDYEPGTWRFAGNRLTGDPARFEVHREAFDTREDLRLGGVTWSWLDAAFRSSRLILDREQARRITLPVLIASAGREVLVSTRAQRRLASILPDARLIEYPDAFHEILMEREAIRSAFWSDFDTFLAEHGI
ncbi:MAG: alpha/beta hydrolase [Azospirillaceae bacterium]